MKRYLAAVLILFTFSLSASEIKKSSKEIKSLKRLKQKDYRKFKYSETILTEKVKRTWELSCEELQCRIDYFRRDIPNKKEYTYEKDIKLSDEKEKEGIVKKIAEGMQKLQKGTAVTTNISWESVLILGNGSAYYGDAQNEEFYPILDRLLGENFEEIEEKIEEEINGK